MEFPIDTNQFPLIKITHVPTNKTVEFNSYIERFSDNFNSQWDSTDVIGRMDDIKNFKKTTRVIELGWTVISEDISGSSDNYNKCSTLMAMLYPVYNSTDVKTSNFAPIDNDIATAAGEIEERISQVNIETGGEYGAVLGNLNSEISNILTSTKENLQRKTSAQLASKTRKASLMSSPPIFKINFANLIRDGNNASKELYGTIEGFKYEPDVEMGFFIDGTGDEQMMYPKVVSLSFAFTVIHTSPLGWEFSQNEYRLRNQDFPFFKKK